MRVVVGPFSRCRVAPAIEASDPGCTRDFRPTINVGGQLAARTDVPTDYLLPGCALFHREKLFQKVLTSVYDIGHRWEREATFGLAPN